MMKKHVPVGLEFPRLDRFRRGWLAWWRFEASSTQLHFLNHSGRPTSGGVVMETNSPPAHPVPSAPTAFGTAEVALLTGGPFAAKLDGLQPPKPQAVDTWPGVPTWCHHPPGAPSHCPSQNRAVFPVTQQNYRFWYVKTGFSMVW